MSVFVLCGLLHGFFIFHAALAFNTCEEQHNFCRYDTACSLSLSLVTTLCPPRIINGSLPSCPRLCALSLVALLRTRGAWGDGRDFLTCQCFDHIHCRHTSAALLACSDHLLHIDRMLANRGPDTAVDCALAVLLCHTSGVCGVLLTKTIAECEWRQEEVGGCFGPLRTSSCVLRLQLLSSLKTGILPLTCYCSGTTTRVGGCGGKLYGDSSEVPENPAVDRLAWTPMKTYSRALIALSQLRAVINEGQCDHFRRSIALQQQPRICPVFGSRQRRSDADKAAFDAAPPQKPLCYFLGTEVLNAKSLSISPHTVLSATAVATLVSWS